MQIDGSNERHIQVSFFIKNEKEISIPDDVFDVPTTADSENLNALVNQSIKQNEDDWTDTKFELLIGETFLRSTLNEFIEEYSVDTEHVVKIECILGLEPPKPLFDLPAPDWISSVHSFNKYVLATTFNGEILVWDRKGKKIAQISKDSGTAYKCSEIITSPKGDSIDGLTLAVSGEKPSISILEFRGKMATTLQQLRGHERSVSSIATNKDKTRLISGAFDSHLKVWNLQESAGSIEKPTESNDKSKRKKENFVTKVPMVTLGGHKDAVVAVKWSAWNDAHCVSASWDHSIAVWDLELAGEISRIRHSKAFTSIDVHQTTGLVISGSADSIPRLFDTRSTEGSLVKQSFVGHTGWISSVKWHYAQPNVFISGSFDSVVKLWDIRSSKTSLYDLHGHTDRVMCVASGDDATILSGGADSTVKVFGQ